MTSLCRCSNRFIFRESVKYILQCISPHIAYLFFGESSITTKKKHYNTLAAVQRRSSYDYNKHEQQNAIFRTSELLFAEKLPFSVRSKFCICDKETCIKLMPSEHGPFRINSAQQHMLTIDQSGASETILGNQTGHALSSSASAIVGKGT